MHAPPLAWVPLPQTEQVDDPAGATEPGGQATQAAEEVDPVWVFAVPAGQGVQLALPVAGWKVPAAQGVQENGPWRVLKAVVVENWPAPQGTQLPAPDRKSVV